MKLRSPNNASLVPFLQPQSKGQSKHLTPLPDCTNRWGRLRARERGRGELNESTLFSLALILSLGCVQDLDLLKSKAKQGT